MKDEHCCDGCCYRTWHNGDRTKCNFLKKHECLIYELEKAATISDCIRLKKEIDELKMEATTNDSLQV